MKKYIFLIYLFDMNVVALRTLRTFWEREPESEQPLRVWYTRLCKSNASNWAELKQAFPAIDYTSPHTVFDVAGNKYRVIVIIDYQYQFAKIRQVLNHAEYDRWTQLKRQGLIED